MLNVFYLYGGMWGLILLLYSFGWSDLCIRLSDGTLLFVFFMITVSFIIGYLLRKHFKFKKLTTNPHKSCFITIALVIFYIVEFIYARNIPLIRVLSGQSMYEDGFQGLPVLHFIVSVFIFIYSFYLVYLFACFKKKSLIVEYVLTISMFVLLFQRQNIFIVLFGAIWILLSSPDLKRKSGTKKFLYAIAAITIIVLALYVFGIMGNMRYGIWDSNDASMIVEVGKINSNFPDFISKSYAWAYIYAISPLANLQYNINLGVANNVTTLDVIWHYIPNFVSKHLAVQNTVTSDLIVSALNVCTAFSDVFKTSGYAGMYFFYLFETAIAVIIVLLYGGNERYKVCVYMSVTYFYLLSFFSNPIIYDVTALLIVYMLIFRLVLLAKIKFHSKYFAPNVKRV